MKKNVHTLSMLSLLLFAASAHAEIFVCKDASGRTLTSDRPIPECKDRSMRVLGESGTTKREIAAPLTAEQKKQKEEEEAKRRAEKLIADEQRRQDRALLARFKSEGDIESARKRDLELVREQIRRDEIALDVKGKYLLEAQKEAEFYKGKPMPANLTQKLELTEQAIQDSKRNIAEKQGEIGKINEKYDATLKRFRELTAPAQASAAASSAK